MHPLFPYTLHPTPYTLHPTPYTLHPLFPRAPAPPRPRSPAQEHPAPPFPIKKPLNYEKKHKESF